MTYRVMPIQDHTIFKDAGNKPSPFDTTWGATLALLEKECSHLQYGHNRAWAQFVIEIDVPATSVRKDGQLYERAVPSSPAVCVKIEVDGGTMSFPCNTFGYWQHNIRAIALAMESLRRVDRYGVGQGRQYVGLAQIGMAMPGSTGVTQMSKDGARAVLVTYARVGEDHGMRDDELRRRAIANTHPDRHGETSRSAFEAVSRAWEVLS